MKRNGSAGLPVETERLLLRAFEPDDLAALAFEELGFHRVIARVEARNTASARVLARLGMRREAEMVENERVKGEWQSESSYAMLEREWAATDDR